MKENYQIKFTANDKGKPPTFAPILSHIRKKVADCEIHFYDGLLKGYKLQGFVIWERIIAKNNLPVGKLSVTGPDFTDLRPGITLSYSLLKLIDDDEFAHRPLSGWLANIILDGYQKWKEGNT